MLLRYMKTKLTPRISMCQKLGEEQSLLKEERKWSVDRRGPGEEPEDVRKDASLRVARGTEVNQMILLRRRKSSLAQEQQWLRP